MDPLSVTASIIAIVQLTSDVIKHLNDVKDAPKDRARLTMEVSNLSNLLVTLNCLLEEGKSNEAWYKEVNSLGVKEGPLDQYRDALEKLQLKVLGGKGLAKLGNAIVWKFSKKEVASILARSERLKNLIQIALQMDHFKLSQEVKKCMDGIHEDNQAIRYDISFVRSQIPVLRDGVSGLQVGVDELQLGFDGIQQHKDRQKHHMLMEWISSTNFPAQQSDLIDAREAGTGQWFLQSPKFAEWVDGSNETLFCPGIPGAGKTMMAAISIDHLCTKLESDAIGIAYIFCNYKAQEEQTTTRLLAAILKQLVQARPSIPEPVSRLYEDHYSRKTRPLLKEIFSALQNVVKSIARVYIIVDAVDECSDQDGTRSRLLAKLRDLQREADVHLMATSRHIPDIENKFQLVPWLEVRASKADVKQYVEGHIHRLPRCIGRDDKLRTLVEDTIVEAVDGMFLLARLHVDSLLDKRTEARVLSMLEKLSKGSHSLNDAYDEAIGRVETQLAGDTELAKKALSWITYAQRPLTTGELCHALAVRPCEDDFDDKNIYDVEDVVSVCAGLVAVDHESNVIRLVHYTTQKYFEQIRENWNPTAQLDIASVCLTYLSFHRFRSGSCPNDEEFESRLEENIFLDYASRYWDKHVRTVQEQVYELALRFLQDVALISCAEQAMSISHDRYREYSQNFPKEVAGLHLTARNGLLYLLERLLSELEGRVSILANVTDDEDRKPLLYAAQRGQEAVVKLLVEQDDIDADSNDRDSRTPLLYAAENGPQAALKLLIERDNVDVDLRDNYGRTPLSYAAEGGHEAAVKLLVERADINADSKDYTNRTPLWWAALSGKETTVNLLVDRDDVDAESKDSNGQTPLWMAARNGHETIVKLLIERDDIDAESKDSKGRTPLWAAETRGNEAVVKLLRSKLT